MTKFSNSKAKKFLDELAPISLDDDNNDLASRCKFNFSYFSVQECSQDFCDWTPDQLHKLLNKLKFYSQQDLEYWQNQSVGAHGKILSIYDQFPHKTDFIRPKHVPHQVSWGRFRLESAVRLVGFIVPDEYSGKTHNRTKSLYCQNTFYVVYLDRDHRFYKTERA